MDKNVVKQIVKHYRIDREDVLSYNGVVFSKVTEHLNKLFKIKLPGDIVFLSKRYKRNDSDWTPFEKGGYTSVCLVLEDGSEVFGYSVCSIHDTYNYSLGKSIALGRAVTELNKLT